MNTDNGALEFESTIDNDLLDKAIDQSVKKMEGMVDSFVKGGEEMDDAMKITTKNIEIQKKVIADLERQIFDLNQQIDALSPGTAQDELRRQAEAAAKELNAEKEALKMMKAQVDANEKSQVSLRTRIRELTEDLVRLETAGQRETEQYREKQAELAKLTDAYQDARDQARRMASDEAVFQGIVSGLGGIAGAASAAQGAMGLLAGENENLQKIMLKVQSLMSITIGLQQVEQALNKDSSFMLNVVAKAKTALATATTRLGTALRLTNVQAKALMATLTLGLSVAITAVIALIERFKARQEAEKEAMEESIKALEEKRKKLDGIADEYGKQVAAIERLRSVMKSETAGYNDKIDAINQLRQIIPDYNAKLSKEGDVIWENKTALDEYLVALDKSLRYKAAMQELEDVYANLYKAQRDFYQAYGDKSLQDLYQEAFAARGFKPTDSIEPYIQEGIKKQVDAFYNLAKGQIDGLEQQAKDIIAFMDKNSLSPMKTTGGKPTGGKGSDQSDAFKDNLAKMKALYDEYNRWVASSDKIVRDAAAEQFASILKEGDSYLHYLENQRDAIMQISNRTAEQEAHLLELNSAIAEETTRTVIADFSSALQDQLSKADDVIAKLDIIREKRDQIDDNDPDAAGKKDVLNQAETNVTGQIREQYDQMLTEYGNFEQRKQAIIDEYDEKRRIAAANQDEEMIQRLNEAQAKALSSLASGDLMNSDSWALLFGNLDELTAQQIDKLVAEIESKFDSLSGIFDPVDLQSIRSKLNEAKAILVQDNPFKAIGVSIKAIFKDAGDDSKDSAAKIKKNWKNLAEATDKSFEFVTDAIDSCEFLKDAIGDVGATAISSLATIAATSIAVATAIKTAENSSVILAIIQAALTVIQAVIAVVKSILGNQDKQFEEKIKSWKSSVEDLKNAYTQLSWEIEHTLGAAVYEQQRQAIANMQMQQYYLRQMIRAESAKKKSDEDKLREYREQIADLDRDIADMLDDITEDILQTTAKDFSDELGDALAEAFGKGKDAAEDFENTVNGILRNAILNQLKKRFLEQGLQSALDNLEKSMGYWDGDKFIFDGLTQSEVDAFKSQVSMIGEQFQNALEAYKDIFSEVTDEEGMTGSGIKSVTEETASILVGQIDAIRINQMESLEAIRQQLVYLSAIAQNTSFNRNLAKLDDVIRLLDTDTLRGNGLS